MDPLSIIAGSLAVLGVAGKALQGAEKAWDLRRRDQEFAGILDQVCNPKITALRISFPHYILRLNAFVFFS
jgi:hypothetical protein